MTLKAGFQLAEAQLLLEMAQHAYAGTPSLSEAAASCGGNPTDGTPGCQKLDCFWQHHLGNYLKYMNQQYGG